VTAELLRTYVRVRCWCSCLRERVVTSERGEGVVSLAIGVLVMAFLGALLWVAFKSTLIHATTSVDQQVGRVGQ
jgi:hypothetical protein